MKKLNAQLAQGWQQLGPRFLPFADAASAELPLGRLLRLSLFQVSVGMAVVLLTGTLNRVMILELDVPAWLVSLMVALPVVFAPFRALVGFRSDTHKSVLGWRRVPYIWIGTMLQFGGLAIMPFALLVLSGDTVQTVPPWVGQGAAGIAFLLVGAGLHTTQTAGLALATDVAPADKRPRVVALLYVMLLVGMVAAALSFGVLLAEFDQMKLIQVIQGAAAVTIIFNSIALWKQEARNKELTAPDRDRPSFTEAWRTFRGQGRTLRLLTAVGLGTAGFSMQDVLLEPYGGQVLGLSVSETTLLTAMLAGGMLIGFMLAAQQLNRGRNHHRLAAVGVLIGLVAFSLVIFAAPLGSATMFRAGAVLIGLGGGLFGVSTLTAVMEMAEGSESGIALGAWGAVQATAMGCAIALGGAVRDVVNGFALSGALGPAMNQASTGYGVVYHLEILLLFATLVAVGPLVRSTQRSNEKTSQRKFGLAEFPG
ncbi:BCD family MFS transporter [Rhodovibrio salinarum]|uniref:MFS transporter n=1 Tax=Rhodovibrio salinarum TaxID=1087 RepID=A0A934QGB0_9PROT|nr:BCD family MFS transporter [Rhodovibrio salinarum]MBK1696334.1 MFS transporter [Rhodovibrio salinarum]